jgi:hypothetical protein
MVLFKIVLCLLHIGSLNAILIALSFSAVISNDLFIYMNCG